MAKKKDPPEIRNLEVALTDEELKAKADEVAAKRKLVNELKAQKKAAAAGYKVQIDDLDATIDHLCSTIRDKREVRPVECRWVRDDGRKMMVCIRVDTGAQVDARKMTEKELQVELPGVDVEGAAGELLDGREPPRAEGTPPPTLEELPDLPQVDAAPPPEKKRRGRKPKAETDLVAPPEANGSIYADDETFEERAQ